MLSFKEGSSWNPKLVSLSRPSAFLPGQRQRDTHTALAKICGVTPQAITNWKTRGIPPSKLVRVAQVMGVTSETLSNPQSGVERVTLTERARVPIYTEMQIARLTTGETVTADRVLSTDIPVSERAFAMEIKDASMQPAFAEGDRVIIDPAIPPQPGDYVVAIAGTDKIIFRRYRETAFSLDKSGIELSPLNTDYPTISSATVPVEVVGVMIEHRRYRRK